MNAGRDLIDRCNWIVDADLSAAQKLVLMVLARHDGPNGIFPSRATIARKAGLSLSMVKRVLNELEAMGLIRRHARFEEGSRENTTSLYFLTLPAPQVGPAVPQVGHEATHVGHDVTHRWGTTGPGVGHHMAPEQPSLTAFLEQPGREAPLAPKRASSETPELAADNSSELPEATAGNCAGDFAPDQSSQDELKLPVEADDLSSPRGRDLPSHLPTRSARVVDSQKSQRRRPETAIPGGFAPDQSLLEMASKELGFDSSRISSELAKFIDHATEKDRRARDWQAAFRRWLRNASEWQKHSGSPVNTVPRQPSANQPAWRQPKEITG